MVIWLITVNILMRYLNDNIECVQGQAPRTREQPSARDQSSENFVLIIKLNTMLSNSSFDHIHSCPILILIALRSDYNQNLYQQIEKISGFEQRMKWCWSTAHTRVKYFLISFNIFILNWCWSTARTRVKYFCSKGENLSFNISTLYRSFTPSRLLINKIFNSGNMRLYIQAVREGGQVRI